MTAKILFLGRGHVERLKPEISEVIDAVAESFRQKGKGKVEFPLKPTIHPRQDSFLRALAGYLQEADVAGLKWVSAFPGNADRGLPLVAGLVLLNDPDTGIARAIMDASLITAWRTAAVSAVAARHLAIETASVLAVCGAGIQGSSHLEFLSHALPGLRRVYVFDPDFSSLDSFLNRFRPRLPNLRIEGAASPRQAVEGAQVVVTAAPMRKEPLGIIKGEWLAPGVLCLPQDFDSYFAPSAFSACAKFFCDDQDQFLWFKTHGRFSHVPKIDADLGQLSSGNVKGRETQDEQIMSIHVGIALGDLIVADLVYRKACADNVGVWLDLWE